MLLIRSEPFGLKFLSSLERIAVAEVAGTGCNTHIVATVVDTFAVAS